MSKKFAKSYLIILVIAIFIMSTLTGCAGGNETPSPTGDNTGAKQEEKPQDEYIKAGMYKVGQDIPAGEYFIIPEGLAYFQVSKDSTGSLESIIANDNFSGTRYVTVSEGQYLEIRAAKMISADKAPNQEAKDGKYPEGMYKIGKEIPAGEYKVVSEGGLAYYEVTKDSKGDLNSIITNDNFEGEKYITVKEGNYLKLNGCYLISK
ncbi:hypothetical protein [Lutispora thermophila]|nr:hypothetical protein [Lutispora thermophila]